jgi:hypothetical protein
MTPVVPGPTLHLTVDPQLMDAEVAERMAWRDLVAHWTATNCRDSCKACFLPRRAWHVLRARLSEIRLRLGTPGRMEGEFVSMREEAGL